MSENKYSIYSFIVNDLEKTIDVFMTSGFKKVNDMLLTDTVFNREKAKQIIFPNMLQLCYKFNFSIISPSTNKLKLQFKFEYIEDVLKFCDEFINPYLTISKLSNTPCFCHYVEHIRKNDYFYSA